MTKKPGLKEYHTRLNIKNEKLREKEYKKEIKKLLKSQKFWECDDKIKRCFFNIEVSLTKEEFIALVGWRHEWAVNTIEENLEAWSKLPLEDIMEDNRLAEE